MRYRQGLRTYSGWKTFPSRGKHSANNVAHIRKKYTSLDDKQDADADADAVENIS